MKDKNRHHATGSVKSPPQSFANKSSENDDSSTSSLVEPVPVPNSRFSKAFLRTTGETLIATSEKLKIVPHANSVFLPSGSTCEPPKKFTFDKVYSATDGCAQYFSVLLPLLERRNPPGVWAKMFW